MSTGRGAAVEIPASTKKVVQQLKEVVGNKADEEIYAMLKECNMDLNETAQRLLNQDPFHEVKRKRDKKKEGGGVKESVDVRGRPGSGGNYGRGGGRGGGAGRGNSLPRQSSVDYSGGRGRPFARENGIHPSSRGSSAIPNSLSGSQGLPKPSTSPPVCSEPEHLTEHSDTDCSSVAVPIASQPATSQAQGPSTTGGSPPGLANGSSNYVRAAPVPQGAWGPGHATMADMLKARAAPPPVFQAPSVSPPAAAVSATPSASYSTAGPSVLASESSEFYSSATDPVLHSLDSHAAGAQRPIGDRPTGSSSGEIGLASTSPSQQSLPTQSIPMATAMESSSVEAELEDASIRPPSPLSISPPSITDAALDEAAVNMEAGTSPGPQSLQAGGRTVLGGSHFNGRPMYASQQQPVGTQKGAGVGLEWKPKGSMQGTVGGSTESSGQARSTRDSSILEQAMHTLNMQDNEPVIIPNHLRVPEADRTQLSFGSFGADFRTSFGTSFGMEEVEKSSVTHVESVPAEEIPVEQPTSSSVEAPVELAQPYGHQQAATSAESLSSSMEAPSIVHPASVAPPLEQLAKAEPVVQQSPHYPFLGVSNYPGFGLMPQIPGAQYSYEQAEPQQQDVSRIPSLMPYSDPTTSYYTSAFRPGTDGDSRYFSHPSSNTSSKYSGNMGLMTGPTLPSSQEGVNPMLTASAPSGAQTSQPGSNVQQAAQAIPQQQAVPMHYPTQPPLGHFGNFLGYQYVPPTYPYLQPPYHQSYNPNSSAYAQPPTGSSYTPAAASSYPTGGAAAVKYPLPQYKPGTAAGNVAHSAAGVGYGGYTTAPSGYATNPAVTGGNTAGYEDVNTTHYKDNTLYIPGQQQGEVSTVWIQQALPRDMVPSGGMQTNSYYNLGGQGQHSGYTHSQQPTHGHTHPGAGYGNLYHPSQQSGPAPSHQMLQQPQGMGGGAGNAQAGGYQQQPQRTQQTWNPNY